MLEHRCQLADESEIFSLRQFFGSKLVLHSCSVSGMCTMIFLCDGEKSSMDQQVKYQQACTTSSSSTQMDAQSMCFAVKLFPIVSADLHTPNIQQALLLFGLLALQIAECIEKHWSYGVMRTLSVSLLP